MATTKTNPEMRVFLNVALWLFVTIPGMTEAGLLSNIYKENSDRDRPIILILDDNSNDDGRSNRHQHRHNDRNSYDRADDADLDNVKVIKLHDSNALSNRDSKSYSSNSNNRLRRPRYNDENDRPYSGSYSNRNIINPNKNNDKNNRNLIDLINDNYNRNDYNDNRSKKSKNSDRYFTTSYGSNDKSYIRKDKSVRNNDSRYKIRDDGRNDKYNRNNRYRSLISRTDDRSRYDRNRQRDREDRIDKQDREIRELEKNILKSPLVQTLLRISNDLRSRKDSCEENGRDSCEDQKVEETTDDPCDEKGNSCEDDDNTIYSTKGAQEDYVSEITPYKCC